MIKAAVLHVPGNPEKLPQTVSMDALDSLVNFACLLSSSNLPKSKDNADEICREQEMLRTKSTAGPAPPKYSPETAVHHLHSSANIQEAILLHVPGHDFDTQMQRCLEIQNSYSINGNCVQVYVNRGSESTSCGQRALNRQGVHPTISCPCDSTFWTTNGTFSPYQYSKHSVGAGETSSCTNPRSWPYQWLCDNARCMCCSYAPTLCSAFNDIAPGSLNGVRSIKPDDRWM